MLTIVHGVNLKCSFIAVTVVMTFKRFFTLSLYIDRWKERFILDRWKRVKVQDLSNQHKYVCIRSWLSWFTLLRICTISGDFPKENDFLQKDVRIAKEIRNKKSEGWGYITLGSVHHGSGDDFRKAIELGHQGLVIAKEVGEKVVEGKAYWNLSIAYSSLYDFRKAIDFYQKIVSIAKETENKRLEGISYIALGCVSDPRCDFRKAIEFNQKGLVIAKEAGDKEYWHCVFFSLWFPKSNGVLSEECQCRKRDWK